MCTPRLLAASSPDGARGWMASGGKDVNSNNYFQTTEIYRVDGTWTNGPNLPTELHDHCQVQVGTQVFIIGGRSGAGSSSSIFLLENNGWREMSSMIQAREFHACVELLGKIYTIGGEHSITGGISSVEIYDPNSDTWEDGPELPIPLFYAQAITFEDTIYLFGGQDNKQIFTLGSTSSMWEVLEGVEVDESFRAVFPAPVVSGDVLEVCFQ